MADHTKVKPAKATGGTPSDDELDQIELLNGMGVSIQPGEVQRLIEALRARATLSQAPQAPAPIPTPVAAPPPPVPQPCVHQTMTQRIPVQRRRAQPPARARPRPRYQLPPSVQTAQSSKRHVGVTFLLLLGFVVTLPMTTVIAGTFLETIGFKPRMETYLVGMFLVLATFLAVLSIISRRRREQSQAQPPPRAAPTLDYDDEEDDEYAHQTYIHQRWQGDNGLNGRVGWENNGRAY